MIYLSLLMRKKIKFNFKVGKEMLEVTIIQPILFEQQITKRIGFDLIGFWG